MLEIVLEAVVMLYQELLHLMIIFLREIPSRGISFKAPAGLHRARWMAKAVYSLKVWIFRSQFKLTKTEEKGLGDICLFTVKVYFKILDSGRVDGSEA